MHPASGHAEARSLACRAFARGRHGNAISSGSTSIISFLPSSKGPHRFVLFASTCCALCVVATLITVARCCPSVFVVTISEVSVSMIGLIAASLVSHLPGSSRWLAPDPSD